MVPSGPGLRLAQLRSLQRQAEGLHGHHHAAAQRQREPHHVGRQVSPLSRAGPALWAQSEVTPFPLCASDLQVVR